MPLPPWTARISPLPGRGLEVLYDQYLLTEPAPGRYRMHDLIREHARALADRLDPDQDRDAATTRLLDYYQHTAARADALIARRDRPGPQNPAAAHSAVPAAVPALNRPQQALAWARAERASLLTCLDHATAAGQHARVTALAAGLAGLLRHDGPWAEAITRHEAAVRAARHLGDRLAQALEQALDIYRDLGDRGGEAMALNERGTLHWVSDDLAQAESCHQRALDLARAIGSAWDEAHALAGLGRCALAAGRVTEAADDLRQALEIFQRIGAPEADGVSRELAALAEAG
jgi:tetratricopeptide (TPR) repeat protein